MAIPPQVTAQLDDAFNTLHALMARTTDADAGRGEAIKNLVRQLIEQLGPVLLTWIITLLGPDSTPTDE
jgi:hypothetical protein